MALPTTKPIERRTNKRVAVTIPIRLHLKKDNQTIPGDIEDISLGGAFIRCPVPISVGDEITLEINFLGMQFVAGRVFAVESLNVEVPEKATENAIIRWTKSSTSFGVEFENLSPQSKGFIARLVAYFERTSGIK